jgi:hypothetical protein
MEVPQGLGGITREAMHSLSCEHAILVIIFDYNMINNSNNEIPIGIEILLANNLTIGGPMGNSTDILKGPERKIQAFTTLIIVL